MFNDDPAGAASNPSAVARANGHNRIAASATRPAAPLAAAAGAACAPTKERMAIAATDATTQDERTETSSAPPARTTIASKREAHQNN